MLEENLELLKDFQLESQDLLEELEVKVEEIEEAEEFPVEEIKQFSQIIDRMMGAAKTFSSMGIDNAGLILVAKFSQLAKTMGYQLAALEKKELVPFFAGFLAETVEVLQRVNKSMLNESELNAISGKEIQKIEGRLDWLAKKIAPDNEAEQAKVRNILKNL